MGNDSTSYRDEAIDDARETAREFIDDITQAILDNGKASDDLYNDYSDGDAYHHETHVDKEYDLSEADQLLRELSEWEETDKGLWEGLEPRDAIGAQAAYTYGNCVYSFWRKLIEEINDAVGEFKMTYEKDGITPTATCKERLKSFINSEIDRWSA
jgi:hypothetical protein